MFAARSKILLFAGTFFKQHESTGAAREHLISVGIPRRLRFGHGSRPAVGTQKLKVVGSQYPWRLTATAQHSQDDQGSKKCRRAHGRKCRGVFLGTSRQQRRRPQASGAVHGARLLASR